MFLNGCTCDYDLSAGSEKCRGNRESAVEVYDEIAAAVAAAAAAVTAVVVVVDDDDDDDKDDDDWCVVQV